MRPNKITHKLELQDKEMIIMDYASGKYSLKDLGEKHKLHTNTIFDIVKRSGQDKVMLKYRDEVKRKIVNNIWHADYLIGLELIERMADPKKLKLESSAKLAVIFGILADKGMAMPMDMAGVTGLEEVSRAEINKGIQDYLEKRNARVISVKRTTTEEITVENTGNKGIVIENE